MITLWQIYSPNSYCTCYVSNTALGKADEANMVTQTNQPPLHVIFIRLNQSLNLWRWSLAFIILGTVLLDIYPTNLNIQVYENWYANVYRGFTHVTKISKQPRCLNWVNKDPRSGYYLWSYIPWEKMWCSFLGCW